ncbi:MAG: DUF4623 domain-containing protein [Verrucomicrobiota bacterium]|jgi:hypothetical protein
MNKALLLAGLFAVSISQSSAQLDLLWALDPGSRAYLPAAPGDNNQRGMAFNPLTGNVLLVNRTGGLSINRISGATGADLGTLNVTGIAGGTFALNQIAVAADGSIYAANLKASATDGDFKIYRWANEDSAPVLAFSGQIGAAGTRWGDNMDIRGSGNGIQLLFGQGGSGVGNSIAVFTTSDGGLSLTPSTVTVTGITAGETRGGIAFDEGDTFFFKNAGTTTLRYADFNLAAGTSSVLESATLPSGLSGFGPLGSDPSNNLLGAIQIHTAAGSTSQQQLYLFDVNDPSNPVVLDIEGFANPGNRNLNASGAVDFGNGFLFALDTNNGLRGFAVVPEPSTFALLFLGLGGLLWMRRK